MSGLRRRLRGPVGQEGTERALEVATARFMSVDGVVSVGLGSDETGSPQVVVGIDKPLAEVRSALPDQVAGVPVGFRYVGDVSAGDT